MIFSPVRTGDETFYFQGRAFKAGKDPINLPLFDAIKETISSCEDLSGFGSFEESPDEPCIQAWVIDFLVQDERYLKFFDERCNEDYAEQLRGLFLDTHSSGGGFRPTLLVDDEDAELYSAAEDIEGEINDLEFYATLYALSIGFSSQYDTSAVLEAWKENGWDDECAAVERLTANS